MDRAKALWRRNQLWNQRDERKRDSIMDSCSAWTSCVNLDHETAKLAHNGRGEALTQLGSENLGVVMREVGREA